MLKKIKQFINIRIIIFIIASLCIALYTILMISGYSGMEEAGQTTRNKAAGGYYIFYHLLKRLGYKIQYWDIYSGFRQDTVLFYFNYKENQSKDFEEIRDWVARGNILFLCGIYSDTDPFFNNMIVHGEMKNIDVHNSLKDDIDEFSYKSNAYFDKESKGEILLGNSQGSLLLRHKYEQGTVYLFSDSLFLSNNSLVHENNSIFLNNLLKEYYATPVFVHETETPGTASPVALLFKGKLFYLTIHLFLMGVVFLFINGIRFGNPVKVNPLSRRTLQEHLNAVGYFYLKSNAFNLADTYGLKYFVYQVKKILGIKKRISNEEIIQAIKKYDFIVETEEDIAVLFRRTVINRTVIKSEKTLLKKKKKRDEILERLKQVKRRKK
ncbi:MAG: DUF4350 domain-containing protein [Spirochaetales bacterium]|nr:DUF4350 domain-containing protein [Spirochaetales bacterium]